MKKAIVLLVTLGLVLGLVSANAETMTDGWTPVVQEAGKLPEDAQAAFDKALEQLDGATYIPIALLSTQVVAGTNYCFLCQITPVVPDPVPIWALVYIYADLQGNAEIMNVYELYIGQHAHPAE
jgi:hypothetical protein